MTTEYRVEPIGYIRTCFPEKFGIPRQGILAPAAKGRLTLMPPYNDPACVEGLQNCSHIWLSFIFHETAQKCWKPKVRPPRLGGNQKMGVFATRSPFRPNPIGLSVVTLESIVVSEAEVCLYLAGVDLVDRTPIIDIKPYIAYTDSIKVARNSFADEPPPFFPVIFSNTAEKVLNPYAELKVLIHQVLQQNPQPAYHGVDPDRQYKMALQEVTVVWRVILKDQQPCIEVCDVLQ